ncbi:MAG: hypothetical protein ABSH50_10275 [Bryobacteraceae bacterium]
MLLLTLLPIVLRVALLPQAPPPLPRTPDDFSFALLGDTLAHFRLANPPHPMARFFETNFVLQEPSYSSIYPLGQGIALAFGQLVFHQQWAGVLLGAGLFCGLCYWMLRVWVSPTGALVGGLLAAFQFGPLQYWMNTYWGGSLAAAGGCLIFGALPRLRRRARLRDAALLGLGLAVEWLTRPFETMLVLLGTLVFLLLTFRGRWRELARIASLAAIVLLPAGGLSLLQNREVTGRWTTLPYRLSQYQYGVPAAFTFQSNPAPHRSLTPEQHSLYEVQSSIHDSAGTYLERLVQRLRFVRFFYAAPLLLALPVFCLALRRARYWWVLLWLAILALGTNYYPYFYPHYIAAGACLFVLAGVAALERIGRWNRPAARLIFLLCAAQFVFWYGLHLAAGWSPALELTERYESWDFVNHGDPEGRLAVERQLAQAPGKQLVIVRYAPRHGLSQWMTNAADIDRSRVVRALDLGPAENEKLLRYYPDRKAWLLEPEWQPPRLSRYQVEAPAVVPAPAPKNPSPFEEVK